MICPNCNNNFPALEYTACPRCGKTWRSFGNPPLPPYPDTVIDVTQLGVLPGIGTVSGRVATIIASRLPTVQKGGLTLYFPGREGDTPYNLDPGVLELPYGVNILGAGKRNATRFLGHVDGTSRIRARSRGGLTGHFTIENGGFETDGVLRSFTDIDLRSSPDIGFLISNAQNNTFTNCESTAAVTAGMVIENGANSNLFVNTELDSSGTYQLWTRQTLANNAAHPWGGIVFGSHPESNSFIQGIFERELSPGSMVSVVKHTAGTINFQNVQMVQDLGAGKAIVDIGAAGLAVFVNMKLRDPYIDGFSNLCYGIRTANAGTGVWVTGRGSMRHLLAAWCMADSSNALIDHAPDYSGNTNIFVTNGGTQNEERCLKMDIVHPIVATRPTVTGKGFQTVSGVNPGTALRADGVLVACALAENASPIIRAGNGSPEGVVTSRVGSLYLRADGGALTSLYVKETGVGNTGWVAK